MNITVSVEEYSNRFMIAVLSKIKRDLRYTLLLSNAKLSKFDTYIHEQYEEIDENLSLQEILLDSLNNLKLNKFKDYWVIEFDKDAVVKNTTIKQIDIIKLVNYGNSELRAYPYVLKKFKEITSHIKVLKKYFSLTGVVI